MNKIMSYTLSLLLVSSSSVIFAKSVVSCGCNPNEGTSVNSKTAHICSCSLNSSKDPLTGDTGGYELNQGLSWTGGTGTFEVKCTRSGSDTEGDYKSMLVAQGTAFGPGIVMDKGSGVNCDTSLLPVGKTDFSFSCSNWNMTNKEPAKVSKITCQTATGYW